MDDSKNSFGGKSRFAQLSTPRKAGVVGLFLLVGFVMADPDLFSKDSVTANSAIKSEEDIESLFGESSSATFAVEDNVNEDNAVIAESNNQEMVGSLTIPSSTANDSNVVMQNVSYADGNSSVDSDFLTIPMTDTTPFDTSNRSLDEQSVSSENGRTLEPQPSIRFMGMIYPVQ